MSIRMTAVRLRKRWIILTLFVLVLGSVAAFQRRGTPRPDATATFVAGPLQPEISGTVTFRDVAGGVYVTVQVDGLPTYSPGSPPIGPHGFHLHEGSSCEIGDAANPFQASGGHWNPDDQPHGNHAGDFPVLFSSGGKAHMTFFTHRFSSADIVGRTVVIHRHPDDYRTQPAGDAGARLACAPVVRT